MAASTPQSRNKSTDSGKETLVLKIGLGCILLILIGGLVNWLATLLYP
jgi:hypothetical protein